MGVGFVGFVNDFSGTGAPFLGSIDVFGHESEHVTKLVACRFR